MARGRSTEDVSTLQMALVGFQIEKQRIESKMQEIQSLLKGKRAAAPSADAGETKPRVKRELSESARKRIANAQKRRWAEHRKRVAQAAKAAGAAG
jgi:hypothetical protein